uniref:Uncharacterized protein n=1 Tax=Timema shepardi TaxID=629360 RepID=A0A7R9AY91_TIMSH|nr:unnamed protein product [Timema shepardi]
MGNYGYSFSSIQGVDDTVTARAKGSIPVGRPSLHHHYYIRVTSLVSFLVTSRYFPLESGALYLTRIKPSDDGLYRCTAHNLATKKTRISGEASLQVTLQTPEHRPPKFLSPWEVHSVPRGGNKTLNCGASGNPAPTLSWTFGEPPKPVFEKSVGVSRVLFTNVTVDQSGVYTCIASNMAANGTVVSINQTFPLEVLVPPKFISTPVSQVYPAAKTVRFNCTAQGRPVPKIIWYKDGQQLQINGRIKQNTRQLVLSTTVSADSGVYQCTAVNPLGEVSAAARLVVMSSQYQPDPPEGLNCRPLSSSQVLLQWEKPSPKAKEVQAYTYHTLPTDGGEERQDVSVNTSLVVDKLKPFTNYTFYVRGYSMRSASDASQRVTCETKEGVPLGAPTVQLEPTSPTTLNVTWGPLPSKKAQGLVTKYKIQWRRKGHSSSHVELVKGDAVEYIVTGLLPGKKYDVRVLAATEKGWPDVSDEQLVWTTVEMPSSGQQNVPLAPIVHLTVINSTSIEVTWSLPLDNEYKPSGYKLYYRKPDGPQVGPIFVAHNVTQYRLTRLGYVVLTACQPLSANVGATIANGSGHALHITPLHFCGTRYPQTWYEVMVLGISDKGDGEPGTQSILTLPLPGQQRVNSTGQLMGMLLPPSDLEAEPTSSTSINLTWTPGPLASYYTVSFSLVLGSSNASTDNYVRSTSHSVEINELKPHTLYEFKVRTHDQNNSHGPYSHSVECRTLEDVPGLITNVQWKPMNQTCVKVTWKYSNSDVRDYEVAVSSDPGLSVAEWKVVSVPAGRNSHEVRLLIGLIVAVLCLFLLGVVVAYIWWRRCKLRQPSPEAHNTNGNGYYRDWERPRTEGHEMDYYCPSGATLDANLSSNDTHLDTKLANALVVLSCSTAEDEEIEVRISGGYPNGHANGLNYSLLNNGKVGALPQVVRDKTNVHITENPQLAKALAVLSSTAEDGEIKVQILVGGDGEVTASLEERNREVALKSEEDLNATHDTSLGSA